MWFCGSGCVFKRLGVVSLKDSSFFFFSWAFAPFCLPAKVSDVTGEEEGGQRYSKWPVRLRIKPFMQPHGVCESMWTYVKIPDYATKVIAWNSVSSKCARILRILILGPVAEAATGHFLFPSFALLIINQMSPSILIWWPANSTTEGSVAEGQAKFISCPRSLLGQVLCKMIMQYIPAGIEKSFHIWISSQQYIPFRKRLITRGLVYRISQFFFLNIL